MKINTKQVMADFSAKNIFSGQIGADRDFLSIRAADLSAPDSLVFVDNEKFIARANEGKPAVVVTNEKLKDKFPGATVLVSRNVNLSQAWLRQKYDDRDLRNEGWPAVHPSAVIHESVKLPASVTVQPGAVISRGVTIGENTVIMANAVIETGAKIGGNTVIHPHVVIGYDCEIGSNTIVKAGSVIGSEGFGFAQDEKRKHHRIPQLGKVIIGDNVVIGANNCVDRAAYDVTIIRHGTIMDNLCHVAHNVDIGEDCILTAMFCVAGTTKIGNRLIASGMTGILDHLEIPDDTILLHKAGVNNTIREPGVYAGTPIQPLDSYMKNVIVAKKLTEMKKKISELEAKVAKLSG